MAVDPATHRCPDNGARVNLADCSFEPNAGAMQLQTLWRDPEFRADHEAFYYVRVLENPSNPGDIEEWDDVGAVGLFKSPAIRRFREPSDTEPDRKPYPSILQFHTSGGLAAVWAEENTRDAIFAAMKRREVYATSGPRITLRFFAGWGFDARVASEPDPVAVATAGGVPMGGVLRPADGETASPTCRWSTYDALRLSREPDPRVPATLRERAWSSPIWIDAS